MKRRALHTVFLVIIAVMLLFPAHVNAREEPPQLFEQAMEAYARFSDNDIESAILLLEQVIEKNPNFSPAFSALAEAYIQKYFRNLEPSPLFIEKAAAAAEKALLKDARSPQAHKALASVYYAKGMMEEAIEELERAIDMAPDYARALLNLGTCWLHLKDRERALAFFNDAINAGNDDLAKGIAYYNLASFEAEEKKFKASLEHYRQAAILVPAYYGIYYGLGVVYMNLDRDRDAVGAFNEVLNLKPDYLAGHIALASAHHRLGNKESALNAYEGALNLDPESEEAMKGLAALKGKKIGCLFIY